MITLKRYTVEKDNIMFWNSNQKNVVYDALGATGRVISVYVFGRESLNIFFCLPNCTDRVLSFYA